MKNDYDIGGTELIRQVDGVYVSTLPERLLRFPHSKSLGTISMGDSLDITRPDLWNDVGEARDVIRIPAGKAAKLRVDFDPPTDLAPLTELVPDGIQVIELSGTAVEDAALAYLHPLTGLLVVDLYYAPITDVALTILGRLAQLRHLFLGETAVTDQGVAHLHSLTALRTLDLTSTKVGDDGVAGIGGIRSLQHLYLGGTSLSDTGVEYVARLENLLDLEIYNTTITDTGASQLNTLTHLNYLNMAGTSITDISLPRLGALPALHTLLLRRTGASSSGVTELRVLRPDMVIDY